MAQGALITGLTPEVTALRGLLNEAIASEPALAGVLAGKFSGLDTVYRPADTDAHPLTGGSAHDHEGEGVFPLLHEGRAVLLVMGDGPVDAEPTERAAAARLGADMPGPAGPAGRFLNGRIGQGPVSPCTRAGSPRPAAPRGPVSRRR
jgi:hypothetical protein